MQAHNLSKTLIYLYCKMSSAQLRSQEKRDLRYCDQYCDVRMETYDVDEYKDDYVDDGNVRPRRMLV